MTDYRTGQPTRLARALVAHEASLLDHAYVTGGIYTMDASDIVRKYALDFGNYERQGRMPESRAMQIVRNEMARAYKAGLLAKEATAPARGKTATYASTLAAQDRPHIWRTHA